MIREQTVSNLFRILGDETRLRILSILIECELAVHEIMAIIGKNQSAVSNQLRMLKDAGYLQNRKEGTKTYYSISPSIEKETEGLILNTFFQREQNNTLFQADREMLNTVLDQRKQLSIEYFDHPYGERMINPGDTWETLALGILALVRNLDIADFGCGAGKLSRLLAETGNRVIGIDNSASRIETAKRIHTTTKGNIRFIQSDIEHSGLDESCCDLVLLSHTLHHLAKPEEAIREAYRILRKHGQILILDIAAHLDEGVKNQYGDFWMGFNKNQLKTWLTDSGFTTINIRETASDPRHKSIITLIINAEKDD